MTSILRHRPPQRSGRAAALAGVLLLTTALIGCSAQDPDVSTQQQAGSAQSSANPISDQQLDPAMQAELPADVKASKKLTSVNSGSFPPYVIVGSDGTTTGASSDLLHALGQMWGITIEEQTVDGLSSELAGLSSERYQMAFGPVGDFKERQQSNDFIDFVQEFVVFAVPKGNPQKITSLDSTCGLRIAVQAGGSAEKVIKKQATTCTGQGKKAVQVMSFKDQPQSILSVQSGRADAFFSSQAPLTYFVQQSSGQLELAAVGQANGFDKLYQGAVVKKGSPYVSLLQQSLQKLMDNGTYAAIMKKWNLTSNMLDKPGKNLAVN